MCREGFVLLYGGYPAALELVESFNDKLAAEDCESVKQLACGFVLTDRRLGGQESMVVTPVTASPSRTACCIGAAPRYLGKSEPWIFTQPYFGRSRTVLGRI